jgi:CubicO group peptidase (beta-lactamase class C family)
MKNSIRFTKSYYIKFFFTLFLIIPLLFSNCTKNKEPENKDFPVSSLESEGINSSIINEMLQKVQNQTYKNIHSILIVKNGKLVLEEYFNGYHQNRFQEIQSSTKSVMSAIFGIAVDKNLVNLDQKLFSYFPEYSYLKNDKKEYILVKHVLKMAMGLQWDEWTLPYSHPFNDNTKMNASGNWIAYTLQKPVVNEPGEKFTYNSGGPMLLAGIIKNVIDLDADQFAELFLFKPLGITHYEWHKQHDGLPHAGGGLSFLPQDMAKFGYLFLNNGIWQGNRIISENWVTESLKEQIIIHHVYTDTLGIEQHKTQGYGYMWWHDEHKIKNETIIKSVSTKGNGGQFIYLFPTFEMVVVFTGSNYNTPDPTMEMLNEYIIPATL